MYKEFPTHIVQEIRETFGLEELQGRMFNSKLSLVPLIRYWKAKLSNEDSAISEAAAEIIAQIESIPELNRPIEDLSILQKYKSLVGFLTSALIAPGLGKSEISYLAAPFSLQSFFTTHAMNEKLDDSNIEFNNNLMEDCGTVGPMIIKACSLILDNIHGYETFFDLSMIYTLRRQKSGLREYYKSILNIDFVDVIAKEDLPKPDKSTVKKLLNNFSDLDAWRKAVQPEKYEFHGVVKATMVDVTEEEAISQLKHQLLEKNALVDRSAVIELQALIRDYYRNPNIEIGITAIDYPKEYSIQHEYKIRHDLLSEEIEDLLDPIYDGSIIHRACTTGEVVVSEEISEWETPTAIERSLMEKGFKAIIVAPLQNDGRIIGLLQLASKRECPFNSLDKMKLKDIMILFNTSLQRSREEIDNLIDSIIREQYTSIHPSIEWKFIESAYELLLEREKDPFGVQPVPIVFNNVIPLYAQSDIVGSSNTRNRAIQVDLIENLQLVRELLEEGCASLSLPIIRLYLNKVTAYLEDIQISVNSNDEVEVIDFLKYEIDPLLRMMSREDMEIAKSVNKYRKKLDHHLGIIYDRRKAFEDSVAIINDTISSYLEMKEAEIQKTLPHYFEKYKTDGVEFDMYIGQSMLKSGTFSPIHVRNMRLWQIIIMSEVARLVQSLKGKMPIHLETSQLILVHSNPISIRFRLDEKRFDVDGAYNVRYEIIKKRIDKALIKGTNERLTQPGTVSIVYTQDKDKAEYEEYIDHLKRMNLIAEDVEHFELESTQGVDGLKAFRLHVELDPDAHDMDDARKALESTLLEDLEM